MMNDLKRSFAVLFRRKGGDSISEKELVFSASMDLRWFSPKDAQRLVENGISLGLISREGDTIKLNFDTKEVDVPLDFVPGRDVLEPPPKEASLLSRILETIVSRSPVDEKSLVARMNRIQESVGVTAEVAALIAGSEFGVSLKEFYDEVERGLMAGGK